MDRKSEMNARAWDRIADSYFDEISSPFRHPEVISPLLGFLDSLPDKHRMAVADLGCGIGNLLPFLADRFGSVTAVDFSTRMLRRARQNCGRENIRFVRRSMLDLSCFKDQFDVAIVVNSVLSPQLDEVDRILASIAATLKPSGTLVGVFPSMESVLHEAVCVIEQERGRGYPEQQAIRRARRILGPNRYDFLLGVFTDGADRQKFYYSFELRKRLQSAGFRKIQLGKLLYREEPRTWDWLVRATAGARVHSGRSSEYLDKHPSAGTYKRGAHPEVPLTALS